MLFCAIYDTKRTRVHNGLTKVESKLFKVVCILERVKVVCILAHASVYWRALKISVYWNIVSHDTQNVPRLTNSQIFRNFVSCDMLSGDTW